MDVAAYLSKHPPFDGLDPDTVAAIAATVQIEFFAAGTSILDQSASPVGHLYVIRSGAVEILEDGRVVDLAGPGDVFGELTVLGVEAPSVTARAHEDTLCYLIDASLAKEALATGQGLGVLGVTLQRLATRARQERAPGDLGLIRVSSLIARAPVTFRADGKVADAASLMARERISCLLIPSGGGWGILTDRDLRTRVLAAGRSADIGVADVMTVPARAVPPDATAAEVLLAMLDGGFHHCPVVDQEGKLQGVVTDTDLMGLSLQSPFALKSAIERSDSEASAIAAARRLPDMAAGLAEASVDPIDVGHVIGATIDALTSRLLALAVERLGEPPVPWAWMALGSEARHEQALSTDQDHALAYDPLGQSEEHLDAYFASLAEAVTSGLEEAGIPRCRGDAMAVHPTLRRPVAEWLLQFEGWMRDPGVQGSILTSITLDYRRIAGTLDIEMPLDELIRRAPVHHPGFVRHIAWRALDLTPPTGFFRDLVVEARGEHAGRLDVKHGGILIITNLARAWAIRAGRTEKRTLERLRGAVGSGQIEEESRESLEEAFRLLWQVRLEHQAQQVRAGERPDDFIDPVVLGPIARRGLKEAFRIIRKHQRAISAELRFT